MRRGATGSMAMRRLALRARLARLARPEPLVAPVHAFATRTVATAAPLEAEAASGGGAGSSTVVGASERHTFQTETRKLLDIVANALYTDRHIFIRCVDDEPATRERGKEEGGEERVKRD